MFEQRLRQVQRSLPIPYPQRHFFLRELEGDMNTAYDELILAGTPKDAAKKMVLDQFTITPEDARAIGSVHRSIVQQSLDRIPMRFRVWMGDLARASFLCFLAYFLFVEVPMIDFVLAGGLPAQLVILATAIIGLSLQGARAIKWFLLRDHSDESLQNNTPTPLYLAGLLQLAAMES